MKKYSLFLVSFSVLLLLGKALGQESVDKLSVPLSDPNRPAFLKVGILSGSIKVVGTSGKEVLVEAQVRYDEEAKRERKAEKMGLKLIQNRSTGLTVEEDDNAVTVGTRGGGTRTVDITIQVPQNSSLKLSTVNDGDIDVERVNGDIEVNNTNGHVTLKDISGSAVAHALNGNIRTNFVTVTAGKAMSFSSMNGNIDVTFPASMKATLLMRSDQGEIYSDFDVSMDKTTTKVEENPKKSGGKYRVTLEKGMRGTVNGGGAEIQFKNFNGDIYIRRGK